MVQQWFYGFDIAMELIFAFVAFTVAFFCYKMYKVSGHDQTKLFGLAFLSIGLSYVIWAGLNLFLLENLAEAEFRFQLNNILSMAFLGTLFHMCLFVLGLITIAYETFQIKSGKTYYLLLGVALIAIVSSSNPWITFRIISVFLLTYIVYFYFTICHGFTNKKVMLTFFAFVLLLLSNFDFIFIAANYATYIIGHFLELGAYILILISLLSSIKK